MSTIEIIRGNNYPPAQWQFLTSTDPDVVFPLDGSVMKLTISLPTPNMRLVSLSSDTDAALTLDLATSTLSWSYTAADSRAMPLGSGSRYEIERWIDGTQQTLIRGSFSVTDGLNPD